jgi:hypothetical protein
MATVNEVLDIARSKIGQGPEEFCRWYPAPVGTAWCAIFQSFCLSAAGIPTHFAWVSGGFDVYRKAGRTYAPHEAQPGDLVAFDYDNNGPNSYDHVALVESVTDEGIIAINGNWTNKVCRVLHRWNTSGFSGGIAEIARPEYTEPSPVTFQKRKKMFDFALTKDDRIVQFGIAFGCVTHRWQGVPNGGFGDWAGLYDGQPFAVDSLVASRNADGRFDVCAWNSETSQVCYRTQNVAGGAWRAWRLEI